MFTLDPIKNQEDIWHEPDGTTTINNSWILMRIGDNSERTAFMQNKHYTYIDKEHDNTFNQPMKKFSF